MIHFVFQHLFLFGLLSGLALCVVGMLAIYFAVALGFRGFVIRPPNW